MLAPPHRAGVRLGENERMPEPVRPDFAGPNVAGIVPACLGAAQDAWLPSPVAGARSTVLLVLDGLGWHALDARRPRLTTLAAMVGGPVATVVPSTTATALTSITTGLTPGEHGVVGFRFPVDGHVLNALRWTTDDGTTPPDPFTVQRHPAFCNRIVPVVTKNEFRGTGFTLAHMRDAHYVGWSTTAVLVEHTRNLVEQGERFVYAYYPGVDTVAHEFGLSNQFYERELTAVDALVAELLGVLPDDCALLVTADHGQVDVSGDHSWVEVDELGDVVERAAGEGRFRQLFAPRGGAGALADAARDFVKERAWVFTREELIDGGWFGPVAGPVRRRIGDVVLAGRDDYAFVDRGYPREANLKSAHGSLTADEMLVPLVAARGRA